MVKIVFGMKYRFYEIYLYANHLQNVEYVGYEWCYSLFVLHQVFDFTHKLFKILKVITYKICDKTQQIFKYKFK